MADNKRGVDQMTADKMTVDKMPLDEMTRGLFLFEFLAINRVTTIET